MTSNFDPKTLKLGFLRAEYASHRATYRILGEKWFLYLGSTLTHYTNLAGLIGIIESGGFWLSDIRFLNDAEEFHHGKKLASNLLKDLVAKSRYKSFFQILEASIEKLHEPQSQTYYVASFSLDADSLGQWRAYSAGTDGIALVFNNEFANKGISHFATLPVMHHTLAIYDDQIKKRILLATTNKYLTEFQRGVTAGGYGTDSTDVWAMHLTGSLSTNFASFKHRAFHAEKEVRVITHSSQIANHFDGIKHRAVEGRVVPYLSSSDLYNESFYKAFGSKKLPLQEVIVGPIANREVTIDSVKIFLANSGYADVKVRPSIVPFRG